jgi:hypothetical protein
MKTISMRVFSNWSVKELCSQPGRLMVDTWVRTEGMDVRVLISVCIRSRPLPCRLCSWRRANAAVPVFEVRLRV